MSYDDSNHNVRREIAQSGIAGAASATMAKFLCFQATRLKAVHLLITTAGTDAASGVDVFIGTASVGALTTGTSTGGSVVHLAGLDVAVPANGIIELKGKAASATLVVSAAVEHQLSADSVAS